MIRCYVTDRRQADVLGCVQRAIRDGVDLIQVREKDLPARELLELVSKVRDLAAESKTRIVVNDRVDIALASGLHGVHLPSNGLPPHLVRPLVKLLGISAHTLAEAKEAESAQADFVIFGPIFESPGKKAIGLEPLQKVTAAVRIPVLAIGGITAANSREVLKAGAAGFAGIRIFQAD